MSAKNMEQLRDEFNSARSALIDAEEEERNKIARPILRKSVGKCFKYLNSYGSGEKWWLYCQITGFNEKNMTFDTIQFQHTSDKVIEIKHAVRFNFRGKSHFGDGSNYLPVTVAEFNREKNRIWSLVKRLLHD